MARHVARRGLETWAAAAQACAGAVAKALLGPGGRARPPRRLGRSRVALTVLRAR